MDAPIKSMGYSFDGAYVCASSDESTNIEIAHCDTGDYVHTIQTNHSIPNVAWHPNKYVLAYTGDPVGLKIMGINAV
jgi:THO complex subunit 3